MDTQDILSALGLSDENVDTDFEIAIKMEVRLKSDASQDSEQVDSAPSQSVEIDNTTFTIPLTPNDMSVENVCFSEKVTNTIKANIIAQLASMVENAKRLKQKSSKAPDSESESFRTNKKGTCGIISDNENSGHDDSLLNKKREQLMNIICDELDTLLKPADNNCENIPIMQQVKQENNEDSETEEDDPSYIFPAESSSSIVNRKYGYNTRSRNASTIQAYAVKEEEKYSDGCFSDMANVETCQEDCKPFKLSDFVPVNYKFPGKVAEDKKNVHISTNSSWEDNLEVDETLNGTPTNVSSEVKVCEAPPVHDDKVVKMDDSSESVTEKQQQEYCEPSSSRVDSSEKMKETSPEVSIQNHVPVGSFQLSYVKMFEEDEELQEQMETQKPSALKIANQEPTASLKVPIPRAFTAKPSFNIPQLKRKKFLKLILPKAPTDTVQDPPRVLQKPLVNISSNYTVVQPQSVTNGPNSSNSEKPKVEIVTKSVTHKIDYNNRESPDAVYRKIRDKNNLASKVSRQKRRKREFKLEEELKELESVNGGLKLKIVSLEKRVTIMKNMLRLSISRPDVRFNLDVS